MSRDRIEDILASVAAFPSIPGAAARLLTMLNDPEVTAAEIEDVLRYDPGLTAGLLRLANSSYFGFAQKIGSLRQAIVTLGSKQLIQMVMTTCMSTVMNKGVQGYDMGDGDLWRHSIAVSVASEGLVRVLKITPNEEIFTAALLHDIGKLILGSYVKDDYAAMVADSAPEEEFQASEKRILGADHAEIGARILETWSFPQHIITAVRFHHRPDEADPTDAMIDLVHVANVLCRMIGVGIGNDGLKYAPAPGATQRLGLKTMHLETVASETLKWIDELAENLTVGKENG
ncbi:MAG: HDOD domain-containing protein [Pseudomonadota bacterium]